MCHPDFPCSSCTEIIWSRKEVRSFIIQIKNILNFRFFCPPPSVYLQGGGWARKREQFRQLLQTANPQLSRITPAANMHAELQKADPRVHIGIQALRDDQSNGNDSTANGAVHWPNDPQELDFSNGKVRLVYIVL